MYATVEMPRMIAMAIACALPDPSPDTRRTWRKSFSTNASHTMNLPSKRNNPSNVSPLSGGKGRAKAEFAFMWSHLMLLPS